MADNSLVGLDLRTAASLFEGSHNGPVVVKGSAEESLLYKKNLKPHDAARGFQEAVDGGAD